MSVPFEKLFANINSAQEKVVRTLDRDILINAGAGTGKTHTLTQRYVYMLLADEEASPRNVLAITYTDAAAAELRARVQDQLRVTSRSEELSLEEAKGLIEDARSMDQAWISTIHSFCARIIRTHALDINLDPNFVQLDAHEAKGLRRDIFDEFVKAIRIPDKRDRQNPLSIDALEDVSEKEVHRILRDASEGTLLAALVLFKMSNRTIAARIANIMEQKARYGRTMDEVESQPWDYAIDRTHKENILHAKITIELARRFDVRYEQEKTKRSALDFDDLIIKAHELLTQHESVRNAYRNRFRYIMVDEFQDTNPLAYEIIKTLARNNLCLVGDSKQSIFGFNGADVTLIEMLTREWSSDPNKEVVSLSENFRSSDEVLSYANICCAHEHLLGSSMQALEKKRTEKPDSIWSHITVAPVTMVGIDREGKGTAKSRTLQEAHVIAQHFKKLHAQNLPLKDMTVLVRKHKDAELMLQVLEQHDLHGAIAGGKSYYQEVIVHEILDLLRLIRNPHDDKAFVAVALSDIGNISDPLLARLGHQAKEKPTSLYESAQELVGIDCGQNAELAEGDGGKGSQAGVEPAMSAEANQAPVAPLGFDSADSALTADDLFNVTHLIKTLDRARGMVGRHPINDIVTYIYRDRGIFDLWEERQFETERDRANFRKFQTIADSFNADNVGIIEFIERIEHAQTDKLDENIGQWLTEDNQRIHVVTVYKAKGLQYPAVAYLSGNQEPPGLKGAIAYFNDERDIVQDLIEQTIPTLPAAVQDEARAQAARHMRIVDGKPRGTIVFIVPDEKKDHKRNALHKLFRHVHHTREYEEYRRLYYVASTRAQDHLLVTYHASEKKPKHTTRNLGYALTEICTTHADLPCDIRFEEIDEDAEVCLLDADIKPYQLSLHSLNEPVHYEECHSLVQVSASQISAYQKCPWRYWWTYGHRLSIDRQTEWAHDDEEGEPEHSTASHRGTVLHKLFEVLYTEMLNGASAENESRGDGSAESESSKEILTDNGLSGGEISEARVDSDKTHRTGLDQSRAHTIMSAYGVPDTEAEEILTSLDAYRASSIHDEVCTFKTIHPEYQFYVAIDSYYLYGFMDICAIDEQGNTLIVDYKISSSTEDKTERYKEQARLYAYVALAQGAKSVRVVFAQIDGAEVSTYEASPERFTQKDRHILHEEILKSIKEMQVVQIKPPLTRQEALCRSCFVPKTLCHHNVTT